MQRENKNTQQRNIQRTFSNIEKIHPHKMLLYLAMLGSTLVFIFLIFSYTTSQTGTDDFISFKFPKAFIVSLVLLLFSSFSISKVLPAFLADDMKTMKWYLGITLFLGISFTMSQYAGWYELKMSGIYFSGKAAGSYLYLISGLHVLHLAGGLVFLTLMYTQASRAAQEEVPVKALIMVTNPHERTRLEMLTTYWHFIDVVWIFLFFYFLFSF